MSIDTHPLWRGICPECVGFGYNGSSRCGFCRGSGRRFRQIPHDAEYMAAHAKARLLARKQPGRETGIPAKEKKA